MFLQSDSLFRAFQGFSIEVNDYLTTNLGVVGSNPARCANKIKDLHLSRGRALFATTSRAVLQTAFNLSLI